MKDILSIAIISVRRFISQLKVRHFGRTGLLIVLFFAATALSAQAVPPALFVDVNQGRSQKKKMEALSLSKVSIDVRILGYIAETRMTLTFYNPNNRVLAGDLYFPLPQGATISGYALDMKGVMVDGVVVEKHKARQVFEKIVRQGIDPGLVEWVKGNNFKTRVFPIPAKGSRTVMVKYISDLADAKLGQVYHLPLNFKDKVKEFSLRVEVVKSTFKPKLHKNQLDHFQFKKWRDSYLAETSLRNVQLTSDIIIAFPKVVKKKVVIEKSPDGQYYYAIHDHQVIPKMKGSAPPKRIKILWDASRSRADAKHEREFKFLRAYFKKYQKYKIHVELTSFRNDVDQSRDFTIQKGNITQLISALKKIPYDGGTQMASISPGSSEVLPDQYFLFSDGISNFGKANPTGFKRPVYTFSSDSKANHSFLRYLAISTGGVYFNLKRLSDSDVLYNITKSPYAFLRAETRGQKLKESYPSISEPVFGRFTLVGKLGSVNQVVKLSYGTKGRTLKRVSYKISRSEAVEVDLLRRYWAQKKIEELSIFPKKNEKAIIATGKAYGLVTPGTSLIVLENLDQYVENKIVPPRSLAKMRRDYQRIVAQQGKEAVKKKEDKIQYILALWQKRVEWWKTDYKYPKGFRYLSNKDKKVSSPRNGSGRRRFEERDAEEADDDDDAEGDDDDDDSDEREVTGFETHYDRRTAGKKTKGKRDGRVSQSEPSIEIKPRDPNTPYLKKLKSSSPKYYYSVYLVESKKYGSSPAYYLDCADFFFSKKLNRLAIQALSNIAELELENASLLRVLAHKLAQVNRLDLSILLFEEALKLRPEEPQSYRDLALVLMRRGDKGVYKHKVRSVSPGKESMTRQKDYKRSIELLYHVVMNQWDRFKEIEVIALTELNRIIPRAKKAGVQRIPVDPRLIKLLDMDVRIILSWDADLTDMDLWITEPSGEKAYYSHPKTTIGGHVSRDFTRGYGPEEYLLKKAMEGNYKIEVNYYGSSAPKLIGAVTLQVDVYTNYGRPNEKKKSITLRLTGKKETVKVGDIKF